MIKRSIAAYIWKRESTQEWVLELEGSFNDTYFVSRHTEPLSTPEEQVAGLPTLYEELERLRKRVQELEEELNNAVLR